MAEPQVDAGNHLNSSYFLVCYLFEFSSSMQKMEALKRAYAEMILNTAKEAAERVMAAEVRSRQSEQELVSAKEEASRMLVRLKQINDAKVIMCMEILFVCSCK